MKSLFILIIAVSMGFFYSCEGTSNGEKKGGDSAISGLEGTRDDASQLSNAPIDTSSGQTIKKEAKDSSYVKKDTLQGK